MPGRPRRDQAAADSGPGHLRRFHHALRHPAMRAPPPGGGPHPVAVTFPPEPLGGRSGTPSGGDEQQPPALSGPWAISAPAPATAVGVESASPSPPGFPTAQGAPHARPDDASSDLHHDLADSGLGRRRFSWHGGMLSSAFADASRRQHTNQVTQQQRQALDRLVLLDDNTPITTAFDVVRRKAGVPTSPLSFLQTSSVLLYLVNRLPDTELRVFTDAAADGARLVPPRTLDVWKIGGKFLKLRINVQPDGTFEGWRPRSTQARPVQVDRVAVCYSMKTDTSRCRQGARVLRSHESHTQSPTLVSQGWIKRLLPKPIGTASIAVESYILFDDGEHPSSKGPFPILLIFRETSTPIPDPSDARSVPRPHFLSQHFPLEPQREPALAEIPAPARCRSAGSAGACRHASPAHSLPEFSPLSQLSAASAGGGAHEAWEGCAARGPDSVPAFRFSGPAGGCLPLVAGMTGGAGPDGGGRPVSFFRAALSEDAAGEFTGGDDDDDDADADTYRDPADSAEELVQAVRHLRLENSLLKGQIGTLLGVSPSDDPPAYDY